MNEMLAGRFKALLFDLGGTLVKHEDGPVIHRRILEDNGIHVSLKAVTRAHSENERELDMNQIPGAGTGFNGTKSELQSNNYPASSNFIINLQTITGGIDTSAVYSLADGTST
jgi:hypothetical protein